MVATEIGGMMMGQTGDKEAETSNYKISHRHEKYSIVNNTVITLYGDIYQGEHYIMYM